MVAADSDLLGYRSALPSREGEAVSRARMERGDECE
jgi:hypothetical protein